MQVSLRCRDMLPSNRYVGAGPVDDENVIDFSDSKFSEFPNFTKKKNWKRWPYRLLSYTDCPAGMIVLLISDPCFDLGSDLRIIHVRIFQLRSYTISDLCLDFYHFVLYPWL